MMKRNTGADANASFILIRMESNAWDKMIGECDLINNPMINYILGT